MSLNRRQRKRVGNITQTTTIHIDGPNNTAGGRFVIALRTLPRSKIIAVARSMIIYIYIYIHS